MMPAPIAPRPTAESATTRKPSDDVQLCPGCGNDMPALKGAKWAICPTCGYKESCCY